MLAPEPAPSGLLPPALTALLLPVVPPLPALPLLVLPPPGLARTHAEPAMPAAAGACATPGRAGLLPKPVPAIPIELAALVTSAAVAMPLAAPGTDAAVANLPPAATWAAAAGKVALATVAGVPVPVPVPVPGTPEGGAGITTLVAPPAAARALLTAIGVTVGTTAGAAVVKVLELPVALMPLLATPALFPTLLLLLVLVPEVTSIKPLPLLPVALAASTMAPPVCWL